MSVAAVAIAVVLVASPGEASTWNSSSDPTGPCKKASGSPAVRTRSGKAFECVSGVWAERGEAVAAAGTSFSRTLGERFGDEVNVLDYGVKASAEVADAPGNNMGFAAAIAAATERGKPRIYVPPGSYYVSDTIDLLPWVTGLRGEGVTIRWVPGANGKGKAFLRVRQKQTSVTGIHFLGDSGAEHGAPEVGIDLYPTSEAMLQGTSFTDVWVYGVGVGVWSHDPPGGQQQEQILFDRCKVTGLEYGIKFDKRHEDLWTFRDSYLGHRSRRGASVKWMPGSSGLGLTFQKTWMIGPGAGMQTTASSPPAGGAPASVEWIDSGVEGPAVSLDVQVGFNVHVYGTGFGPPAVIHRDQTLIINSEHSAWTASRGAPIFKSAQGERGAVIWTSSNDDLYVDRIKIPGGRPKVLDIPDFLAAAADSGVQLQFGASHVWQTVVPNALRVGGAKTTWFLPDGYVMLQVQPPSAGVVPLQVKDASGRKLVEITNSGLGFFGAQAQAKPVVTGSRQGNVALASLISALAGYGLIVDATGP